jgi:GTP cyclohydrolase II
VLTNNPDKIQALSDHGISVRKRIPLNGYVNIHNAEYLRIKDTRLGHLGASERVGG